MKLRISKGVMLMIREIITDKGTFGSFRDVVKYMEFEKCDTIEIKTIQTWANTYFDRLVGTYTYNEMKKVIA